MLLEVIGIMRYRLVLFVGVVVRVETLDLLGDAAVSGAVKVNSNEGNLSGGCRAHRRVL